MIGEIFQALLYVGLLYTAARFTPGVPARLAAHFTRLARQQAQDRARKAADKKPVDR